MDLSFVIVALCAVRDSLNPCHTVTLFGLLLLVSELRKRHLDASWHAAIFISAVFLALFQFSLGALMPVLYSEMFYRTARVIYFSVGILLFLAGAFHLRDWWRLKRNGPASPQFFAMVTDEGRQMQDKGGIKMIALTIVSAVLLSMLSTVWPADPYIMFNASFITLPGKLPEVYAMLFFYHFFLIVPMLGVFVFVSSGYFAKAVKKAPAMVKIILSALTLALGAGLMYLFQ